MPEITPGEATPKKAEDRATPHEHAFATGHVKPVPRNVIIEAPSSYYSWQHAAAASLHGWAEHEHHEGGAIRLTRSDYEAAIKAASEPVTRLLGNDGKPGKALDHAEAKQLNGLKPTTTTYEPHKPALSPHAPRAKEPS